MGSIIVGVDPHKRSVTIEVIDGQGKVLATGRFGTLNRDYHAMLSYVRQQWPQHRWAVEGAQGVGRPLAQRLLTDGETVIDVPAKLSARVRVFDTGNARKTDPVDAHAVAAAALRTPTLKVLSFDAELIALRLLADRRDELSALRVQTVNRLHRLLAELVPGGAPRNLSVTKAKKMLAGVRPRTLIGKTTRRMAVEELADLVRVDAKLKSIRRELKAAVLARGSHLMELHGIGPAGAARILADVGDIARFPDRDHFASWTGTAPLDASSGDHVRRRLSRAGNRRLNHVLYIAAAPRSGKSVRAAGTSAASCRRAKTGKEALRCLKRRLSDLVYRQLVADAEAAAAATSAAELRHPRRAREGTRGRLRNPARPTCTPRSSALRISHSPSPQHRRYRSGNDPRPARAASASPPQRRRAGAVKVQRPTGRTTLTATSTSAHSKVPKPRS